MAFTERCQATQAVTWDSFKQNSIALVSEQCAEPVMALWLI